MRWRCSRPRWSGSILEGRDAVVRVCGSAEEALEALDRFTPDLLISDIAMPEMDGYELLQRIKSRSPSRPPAIALTAFARPEDRTRALRAGYHAYLAKPVQPGELLAMVAGLAGSR